MQRCAGPLPLEMPMTAMVLYVLCGEVECVWRVGVGLPLRSLQLARFARDFWFCLPAWCVCPGFFKCAPPTS